MLLLPSSLPLLILPLLLLPSLLLSLSEMEESCLLSLQNTAPKIVMQLSFLIHHDTMCWHILPTKYLCLF